MVIQSEQDLREDDVVVFNPTLSEETVLVLNIATQIIIVVIEMTDTSGDGYSDRGELGLGCCEMIFRAVWLVAERRIW